MRDTILAFTLVDSLNYNTFHYDNTESSPCVSDMRRSLFHVSIHAFLMQIHLPSVSAFDGSAALAEVLDRLKAAVLVGH